MAGTLEKNDFYTCDLMDFEKCKEILKKASNQPNSSKYLSIKSALNLCREIKQRIMFDDIRKKIEDLIITYE